MGVGDRLREARLRAGLSQRSLSEPGCSYAYISRIEAGARSPSVKVLRKLAPKLGVSVVWLETGHEPGHVMIGEVEYDVPKPVEDMLRILIEECSSAAERVSIPAAR